MLRNRLNNWLSGALLLASLTAQALPEDWQQEIVIVSDTAQMDRRTGVVIYQGSVVLTQGSLRIESDRLTVTRVNDALDMAVAEGRPARYQQTVSTEQQPTHAEANRIEYRAGQRSALLTGNARLEQDGNEIRGDRILYDMTAEVVTASAPENSDNSTETPQRIRVVIQPQSAPAQEKSEP